jgi:hypothetical protein
MAEITYNIHVDKSTMVATAPTDPPDAIFKAGDKVSFTSNWPDTAIKYNHCSPFEEIKAGDVVSIPAGPYTMKETKDRYHFDCGSYQAAKVLTSTGNPAPEEKVFVAWEGGGDTPRK